MSTSQSPTNYVQIQLIEYLLDSAVLLACRGKKPLRANWQRLTMTDMTPAYLESLYGNNIGVSLGTPSEGLVTIDLDTDEALSTFIDANPIMKATLQTRGRRGGNLWLRIYGDIPKSTKLKGAQKQPVGEWRATGNQTIISGTHPETGKPYRITQEAKPAVLRASDINWPSDVQPCKWPRLKPPPRKSDVESVEHTDDTEHSPTPLCHSTSVYPSASLHKSTSLHHKDKGESILAAIESERRFHGKVSPGVIKLYQSFVAHRFKPEPQMRNAFITQAVPFLFRAVCEKLVMEFSMQFYAANQAIYTDPSEQHQRETAAMLKSVNETYLQSLGSLDYRIYEELDASRKPVFRILRDLAHHEADGKLPPPLFFLSAQNLGDRLDCGCQQAHRLLQSLVGFGIIRIHEQGTARATGHRGKATIYRWMLE